MLPHLEYSIADGLHVPQLAVLRFFQAASKEAMRKPILETEHPSLEFIGVFDREHESTVTKRLQTVYPAGLRKASSLAPFNPFRSPLTLNFGGRR